MGFSEASEPDDELPSELSSLPLPLSSLLESLAFFLGSSFFALALGFSDSEESLSLSSEDDFFLDSLLSESEEGGVSTFYFFFFEADAALFLEAALFLLALEAFETFDSALALLAGTFKVLDSLLLLPSELEPESLLEPSESESEEEAAFFFISSIFFIMASSSLAAFSLAACFDDFLSFDEDFLVSFLGI